MLWRCVRAWGPRALWSVPPPFHCALSIGPTAFHFQSRFNWVFHRPWTFFWLLVHCKGFASCAVMPGSLEQTNQLNSDCLVDLLQLECQQTKSNRVVWQISHFPTPFSKPQNALWGQNLDAHLIRSWIWGGNRGPEITCHLYTQGTPATHRYFHLNWISLSVPTIFVLSLVVDLSVFNMLAARLFWFAWRGRRR